MSAVIGETAVRAAKTAKPNFIVPPSRQRAVFAATAGFDGTRRNDGKTLQEFQCRGQWQEVTSCWQEVIKTKRTSSKTTGKKREANCSGSISLVSELLLVLHQLRCKELKDSLWLHVGCSTVTFLTQKRPDGPQTHR